MLKFKTMKKQNTHPTQALSLVSYTRKLTFFTAKFSHSLFLLLFAILFSQISFAQAPYITNATGSGSSGDLVTSVDYLWNASHLESSICQRSGNPPAIAFVYDGTLIGTNAASPEMDAGITIADCAGHSVSERFVNFDYNGYYPSIFRSPDVTLQQDGKKAIVVFETDITEGSMILELNIAYSTSPPYITISQGYVLSVLMTLAGPLNNIYSTNPRIDGDQEYGSNDRFAVVSAQNNGTNYEPIYSIYEYDALNGTYSNNTSLFPIAVSNQLAWGNPLNFDCINPNIAIGHTSNNIPECVVSYVDGINTNNNNTLVIDYIVNSSSISNVFSYPLPNDIFWYGFENATRICSENGTSPTFSSGNMSWAMTMSVIEALTIGTSTIPNHLLYVNSNSLSPINFYIDDILASAPYLQDKACIDWMEHDAAVAWVHEQDVNTPMTQVNQVVAVMNPLVNTTFGTPPYYYNYWEQVYTTYNTITPSITTVGSPCDIQATSICSDLDLYASGGEYVISEISCGKLYYKLRTINATGYRTNTTKMFNTNLYPVPANDILNITATDIENISVQDIYGHILLRSTLHTGTNTINTSNFPTGNYFLIRTSNAHNTLFSVSH